MRVLHVNDDLERGGAQRVTVDLSNWLGKRGHDVAVCAAPGGVLWPEIETTACPLPALDGSKRSPTRLLKAIQGLRSIILRRRIEVIHAHQRNVALIAALAAVRTGVAVVEHAHTTVKGFRLISYRSDAVFAVGTRLQKMLTDEFRRPAERVHTTFNAVSDDGDYDFTSWRDGEELRMVAVGRLAEQKDPEYFVDLVLALHRTGLPVSACWVGDGPLRSIVERRLRTERIEGLISLVGDVSDARPYIQKAHALCVTSRWEGLPLVILEAMAAGRGVISRDVGSCSDAVLHNRTGYLFPRQLGAPEAAALLRREVLPNLSKAITDWGQAGRAHYESRFTPNAVFGAIEDVYKSLRCCST